MMKVDKPLDPIDRYRLLQYADYIDEREELR